MKKQILLFVSLVFISANVAAAQTRKVTNADLEKFRQKRVQAETEYRENYERLGLPSPEELEKRRVRNQKELAELSERLRAENFERERREREEAFRQAQNEYLMLTANQNNQGVYYGNGYYPGAYFGYQGGFYNRYNNNRFRRNRGFGRGGSFYNSIIPGTVFPQQGVRINSGGVRISVTGGSSSPARIGTSH